MSSRVITLTVPAGPLPWPTGTYSGPFGSPPPTGTPPWNLPAGFPPPPPPPPPIDTDTGMRTFLIVVMAIFGTIAIIVVLARILIQKYILKRLGWDDWLILAMMYIATIVSEAIGIKYGFGTHVYTWQPGWTESQIKLLLSTEVFVPTSAFLTKASILLMYIKCTSSQRLAVAENAQKLAKRSKYLLVFLICHWIATIFGTIFQCTPISANWAFNPANLGTSRCIHVVAFITTVSFIACLTDIVVLALPVQTFWSYSKTWGYRLGLLTIFTFALLATLANITKNILFIVLRNEIYKDGYYGTLLGILSNVEVSLGLVCASVLAVRPIFEHILQKIARTPTLKTLSTPRLEAVDVKDEIPTYSLSNSGSHTENTFQEEKLADYKSSRPDKSG